MVVPGSVDWKAENLSLHFTLSDLKGAEIRIAHTGTPPDMFKENQGVVVEGSIAKDGKTMTSKHLLVKHSEEYKSSGDHSTMEKTLLEQSMFKGQAQ
jgi:cytochrome c-type biogenesis protein CcmE